MPDFRGPCLREEYSPRALSAAELLRWQWSGYARYHRAPVNLLIHVLTWPFFVAGNALALTCLARGRVVLAAGAFAVMGTAFALQGLGHRGERTPPEPFTGPGNALGRIFFEQWITFPRFLLSGAWFRAFQDSDGK